MKYIFALILVWLLAGCATLPPPAVRVETAASQEDEAFRPFAERYRSRAIQHENKGELRHALFAWNIVHSFSPDDPESQAEIERLQQLIDSEARKHFQNGLDYLNNGSLQAARKEFLLLLAYDPDNQAALDYLKTKTVEPDYTTYETRQGDTPEAIAKQIYGDPRKDFLVAYFGDLDSNEPLKPGIVLKLPILDGDTKSQKKPEAQRQPKRRTVSSPSAHDKARAEDHYRRGMNCFLAEDLQGAIREWEETLRLDPNHPNARRDAEKARSLLIKVGSK